MRASPEYYTVSITHLTRRLARVSATPAPYPVRAGAYKLFYEFPILSGYSGYNNHKKQTNKFQKHLKIKVMKKASFALASVYTAKSFTTKLNFVNGTAKKLSIKKPDAYKIADEIEAGSEDAIEPNAFKALFIAAATKHVADKMLSQIPEAIETV
jgi:hypothetical protein